MYGNKRTLKKQNETNGEFILATSPGKIVLNWTLILNFYIHLCVLNLRAVKFSAKLMGKALAKRVKCTILYATETGKSERFAKSLAEIFKHAFDAKVIIFYKCSQRFLFIVYPNIVKF